MGAAGRHIPKEPRAERKMRYIGSALKYMFKNFIFIFVFALVPSYFFALTQDAQNIEDLVRAFRPGAEGPEFSQLFNFFSPFNGRGWPYALVCLASLAIILPMLFGFIEKHMRIGSRTLRGLAGRFNTNFLTTLVLLVAGVAVYELWALIAAGLIFAETLILGGAAFTIIALVTYAGMMALACYLASAFLLWLPCQLITGYNFMDSLAYTNQLSVGHKGGLFLSVFLPAAAGLVVEVLTVWLCGMAELAAVIFIVTELLFLFFVLYISSLMFSAYFRLTGEERMDLKKKYGQGGAA